MNSGNYKTKRRFSKKLVAFTVIILIIGGIAWRLWIYKPASRVITTAGNVTSSTKVINNSASSKSSTTKKASSSSALSSGGSVNTNGNSSATTNKSQWTTSVSGAITVEQPIANATLQSGDTLSGTANVSAVSYTLIDNEVGVISQGAFNVVNGKFSGTIGFASHSSTGRLDVYSTNSQGVEFNEIEIGVKFKSE